MSHAMSHQKTPSAGPILALDAAGQGCSVCLWADGRRLAETSHSDPHGQAESLVPMIERVMGEAQTDWKQLSRLAVTTGPGSFTGLRVGLATARGLRLATGLPLVGVSTLRAYAAACLSEPPPAEASWLLVVVDARRDDAYWQVFSPATPEAVPLTPPVALEPLAALDWLRAVVQAQGLTSTGLVTGDACALLSAEAASDLTLILRPQTQVSAAAVAAVAAGLSPEESPAEPLYLRAPDAAVPRNGGQLRPEALPKLDQELGPERGQERGERP